MHILCGGDFSFQLRDQHNPSDTYGLIFVTTNKICYGHVFRCVQVGVGDIVSPTEKLHEYK